MEFYLFLSNGIWICLDGQKMQGYAEYALVCSEVPRGKAPQTAAVLKEKNWLKKRTNLCLLFTIRLEVKRHTTGFVDSLWCR